MSRTALNIPTDAPAPILEIGGGTSQFVVDLQQKGGFADEAVLSIDHDAECVAHMAALHPTITWRAADITVPSCEAAGVTTGKFALAVDKGTLDCVLCEMGPPSAAGLLEQVHRALRPGGLWVLVSFHVPALLLPLAVAGGYFESPAVSCHELLIESQKSMPPLTVVVLKRATLPSEEDGGSGGSGNGSGGDRRGEGGDSAGSSNADGKGNGSQQGALKTGAGADAGADAEIEVATTAPTVAAAATAAASTSAAAARREAACAAMTEVLDRWHKDEEPLLTAEEEARIRDTWPRAAGNGSSSSGGGGGGGGGGAASGSNGSSSQLDEDERVPAAEAFAVLFCAELREVFPLEDFEAS